jgi:shikimate dehydrogenase
MRRFGLIGYPLTHSFSQKYFTEKFAQLGIAGCVYENFELKDISELTAVLRKPGVCGLNVTIPYKKQVLSFLTHSSDDVAEMGACNCIDIRNGELTGYNTDVVGFRQSLQPFLQSYHDKALILGTGGASAAVEFVLKRLGISFQYVSRTAGEDAINYQELTPEIMATHRLIINTTPLGMYPNTDEFPEMPYQFITPEHHLFDLIYNPAETKFLAKGKERGATIQNGYEMLVLQAEESWRIWNGSREVGKSVST